MTQTITVNALEKHHGGNPSFIKAIEMSQKTDLGQGQGLVCLLLMTIYRGFLSVVYILCKEIYASRKEIS